VGSLRRVLLAALALLTASFGVSVQPASAAATSPKVVIIVGPVGSSTAHYKRDADQVAAEARRYTSDVTKVYTPNATWSRVKSVAQGANILVYLGHGNGWPSPYPPFQTVTKDGLGLDPSSGADSTRTVYYGEQYVREDIRLAPNAVVLLFHLCYASGNTEPGLPQGTFAQARQRVDNYGAGFIGAGARAVFAEGHPEHPVTSYVRQLFTTNRTMASIFRNAPTWHGHLQGPYASQRTPGLRFEMDADTTKPSGFYRSLIGDLSLTAGEALFPGMDRTDGNPADFVVPGAAEVNNAGGIGLFATADDARTPGSSAAGTLEDGTRLRLTDTAGAMPDGTPVFAASVLGGSDSGFVRGGNLVPRDSRSPQLWTLDESAALLSPNGDGVNDTFAVAARFSESVTGALVVKNATGATVKSASTTGDYARFTWDLRTAAGNLVSDGDYTWTLRGADDWGNPGVKRTGTFTIDSTAPVTTATPDATDGSNGWVKSAPQIALKARDATSGVRAVYWRMNGGTSRTYASPATITAEGTQTFEYRATDRAGIRESWKSITFKIDRHAPTISIASAGKAGAAAGTWRGPVTLTPAFRDTVSGVAIKRARVDDGSVIPYTEPVVVSDEGTHTFYVSATDAAGNRTVAQSTFTIDTTAPVATLPEPGDTVPTVTPNGDGVAESIKLPFALSEPGSVTVVVANGDGKAVRTLKGAASEGDNLVAWNGRTDAGKAAPDGRYSVTITPKDVAGNPGEAVSVTVDSYAALKTLARKPGLFFPQDADSLAAKTKATWTLLTAAKVTIRVVDAAGAVVRTGPTAKAYAAGAQTWTWNGKTDAGAYAKRGAYRIVVTATNGTQAASQRTTVTADAFRLKPSVTGAVRGKAFVLTATTAEPLAAAPRVTVRQPGVTAWTVTMTRKSATVWTATITPKRAGTAGTMSLTVKGTDTAGGTNSSIVRLAVR
jgi:flagellar hook assembly protein FlgD